MKNKKIKSIFERGPWYQKTMEDKFNNLK